MWSSVVSGLPSLNRAVEWQPSVNGQLQIFRRFIMKAFPFKTAGFSAMLLIASTTVIVAAELQPALRVLQSVDREGKADGDAKAAWARVSQAKPDELPTLLAALDDAKPLGA